MNRFVSHIAMSGIAAALLVAGAGAAMAHHSYAMFDRTKKITIQGTIKEFQWTNPHIYAWVYVPNPKAKDGQDLYAIEGGSPNMLARKGWTKHTMDPGEKVTIDLNPLKDGRTGGYFVGLVKADGTVVTGDGAAGGNGSEAVGGSAPQAKPPG